MVPKKDSLYILQRGIKGEDMKKEDAIKRITDEDYQAIEYIIQEIEFREFEDTAGSITKFQPWIALKGLLGVEK